MATQQLVPSSPTDSVKLVGYAASSPAAAFDSSWAMVLQPTMTEATAGFFRHQAKAHWAMFWPEGNSSRRIFSTNSSCRLLNSAP